MFYLSLPRLLKHQKVYQVSEAFNTSVVIHGKSHLLIREPSKRKRKFEEVKELEHTNYDLDIANATMQQEIDYLKDQEIEYKGRLNESMKYKDVVQYLSTKEVWMNSEKIKFNFNAFNKY